MCILGLFLNCDLHCYGYWFQILYPDLRPPISWSIHQEWWSWQRAKKDPTEQHIWPEGCESLTRKTLVNMDITKENSGETLMMTINKATTSWFSQISCTQPQTNKNCCLLGGADLAGALALMVQNDWPRNLDRSLHYTFTCIYWKSTIYIW